MSRQIRLTRIEKFMTHTHTHTHTHACKHARTHARTHGRNRLTRIEKFMTRTHTHTNTHKHMHTRTHARTPAHTHATGQQVQTYPNGVVLGTSDSDLPEWRSTWHTYQANRHRTEESMRSQTQNRSANQMVCS